ncbi:MAG TPA: hypothetical protein VEY30_13385 [Myxococcaceae bacterium]|nr:hypothetical protein [Myxococcaceae bacterium]
MKLKTTVWMLMLGTGSALAEEGVSHSRHNPLWETEVALGVAQPSEGTASGAITARVGLRVAEFLTPSLVGFATGPSRQNRTWGVMPSLRFHLPPRWLSQAERLQLGVSVGAGLGQASLVAAGDEDLVKGEKGWVYGGSLFLRFLDSQKRWSLGLEAGPYLFPDTVQTNYDPIGPPRVVNPSRTEVELLVTLSGGVMF